MSVFRLQTIGCIPVMMLAACATSSPERTDDNAAPAAAPVHAETGVAAWPAAVRFDIDNALPIFTEMRESEALLASRFSASVDEDRLRYRASWSVETGDVLEPGEGEAAKRAPATRLGSQRLGQHLNLRLPELAGSPVSLGISTEFRDELLVTGHRQHQHRQATLNWSPGPAAVAVHWAGAATPLAAGTALTCDLKSTVRLPTREVGNHSEGLTLSGGVCSVTADGSSYAGIDTGTWGLGYAWDRPDGKTEVVLSIVDPAELAADSFRKHSPGYEFDVSHRRDFGPLSAGLKVLLREAPAWEATDLGELRHDYLDAGWATQTTLTWNLSYAALSANWANGIDPLWFTPEPGTKSDRFGLVLNLSRWLESVVPDASPQLAMNWNWSQLRPPGEEATGDNALSLDVALYF